MFRKTSRLQIVLLVSVILAILFGVSGCKKQNAIIGKWKAEDGSFLEFFKDGTVEIQGGLIRAVGKYSFPDKGTLRLDLEGLWGIVGPTLYDYKISGKTLTLIDQFGSTVQLTKAKAD